VSLGSASAVASSPQAASPNDPTASAALAKMADFMAFLSPFSADFLLRRIPCAKENHAYIAPRIN
jgi:hypothetical protein